MTIEYLKKAARKSTDDSGDVRATVQAILDESFWIFTHDDMVASLSPRFDAILSGSNPPGARI